MSPFDYVNTINTTKTDIMVDDIAEKEYNGFVVNRSLSYFPDTVALANVMNQFHHLDNKLAYHFLLNIVRKRKRFSKWVKPDVEDAVDVIKQYYGYNNQKAKQVMALLTHDQIDVLRQKVSKGGKLK